MSLEELRKRIKAEGLDNADYIGDDDHIPDAGKKPWDNEPTPVVDAAWVSDKSDEEATDFVCGLAAKFEKRMRAAERLLADKRQITIQYQDWYRDADKHLEAARKEDEQ